MKHYEGLYRISKSGVVIRESYWTGEVGKKSYFKKERTLTPTLKDNGYLVVNLIKDKKATQFYIHRLLALTFIDEVEGKPFVNHIDGDKTNNNLSNLEWCSNLENCIHASAFDLIPKGENRYNSKLTPEDVVEIKKRLKNNETCSNIAKDYPISRSGIYEIKKEKNWKHIKI